MISIRFQLVTKAVEDNLINAILIGNEQLIRIFFKKRKAVQPGNQNYKSTKR